MAYDEFAAKMVRECERLKQENAKLKAELAKCRADKDEMVRRNKLLRDRPDLPIERLQAYDKVMKELAQCQQHIGPYIHGAIQDAERIHQLEQRTARLMGIVKLLTTGEPGSFLATRFPAILREANQAIEEDKA